MFTVTTQFVLEAFNSIMLIPLCVFTEPWCGPIRPGLWCPALRCKHPAAAQGEGSRWQIQDTFLYVTRYVK